MIRAPVGTGGRRWAMTVLFVVVLVGAGLTILAALWTWRRKPGRGLTRRMPEFLGTRLVGVLLWVAALVLLAGAPEDAWKAGPLMLLGVGQGLVAFGEFCWRTLRHRPPAV